MKNALLPALILLINCLSFAQKAANDPGLDKKLFKPYENYFENSREWVYSHLNKSAYLQGDDLWFTSYILNPENRRLNFSTSKLYVELWSSGKKLVSRKILNVKAGTASHFIHLADSLPPGTYCFRTYTNWMRNFYQDSDLNTFITILGNEKEPEKGQKYQRKNFTDQLPVQNEIKQAQSTRPGYDIQFLPESGIFLEGVDNILGIKATDSYGRGVKVSGKVFTSDNQEITSFFTDEYGVEKITIREVSNEQYRAIVTLPDGTSRDLQLPEPEPRGISIQVNPYRPDVVWFRVQTNEPTRKLNKSYIIVIHANGVLFSSYRIMFSNEAAIQFRMRKQDIGKGIIFATIFDENLTPVAERIFYNQDTAGRGSLVLNAEPLTNDTVNIKAFIADSIPSQGFAKLSISVLPGETKLNNFDNSLLSESVLRPALQGIIERPNRFFEKNDIEHFIAIDNLLLTQGWRKYDWPTILGDTVHKFRYPFEESFSVEGRVKNWLKNKPELKSKITFMSPQNKIFLLAPVDSAGSFKFDRVFLSDSTWVIAAASSDKGKNWNRVLQMNIPESFMEFPVFQDPPPPPDKPDKISDSYIPKLTKGDILLKEIVITAKKKDPFSDIINIGIMDRTLELTKENYRQFINMEMLLMMHFNVRTENTQDGRFRFIMGRGITSFSMSGRDPVLMIDGMKVYDPQDILNFPIELVEAVAVNKDGIGGGMDGSAGTIAIKTRTTPLFDNNAEATNIRRLIVNGYAAPRKYFEPGYIVMPGTADYDQYATIFWKPDLIVWTKGTASFKFPVNKEIKTITLRAEGITSEGRIFLQEQKIALPGRN
jgi:hypothetical protein